MSKLSLWVPFRRQQPTGTTNNPMDMVRTNMYATLLSHVVNFAVNHNGDAQPNYNKPTPGWNYTNSFTRGEATPGTYRRPVRAYWWSGSGNTKRWIKVVFTYTNGTFPDFVTTAAFYYSDDNEATYVPMYDEDKNYVITYALAAGPIAITASATWGNVP